MGRLNLSEPVKAKRETKQQMLIDLLKRPEGATLDEIVAATSWQKHYADVRIMPM
jgi:hypothetical protein